MAGAPDLIIIGQVTIDHVVPATPRPWAERIGGNALYAAAGARLWLDPARIGVVVRRGEHVPWDLDALLRAAGIGHAAVRPVAIEHLVEWLIYEPDGSRRSLPRNDSLRQLQGEGGAAAAYLAHLEAISATWDDIPDAWLPAAAIHLAPQVEARHAVSVRSLRDRCRFLSVDPSPHYSRARDAAGLARLLDGASALLPSVQEAAHLLAAAGGDGARVAADLVAAGFPEVVLKQGAQGVLVAARGRAPLAIPALTIDPVDPTGAGDAFCGAYTACRSLGLDPVEAARRAVVAAAMVVGCAGAGVALALSPDLARSHLNRVAKAGS